MTLRNTKDHMDNAPVFKPPLDCLRSKTKFDQSNFRDISFSIRDSSLFSHIDFSLELRLTNASTARVSTYLERRDQRLIAPRII